MFCMNCGKELADGSRNCQFCGAQLRESVTPEDGAVKGLLVLLASFFAMPLKTFRITIAGLREIGGKGRLDLGETSMPHLTWLQVAGYLVVTIIVGLILLTGILRGLYDLRYISHSFGDAVKGFLGNVFFGAFFAVLADWFMMVWLELLTIGIGIANDIKKLVQKP